MHSTVWSILWIDDIILGIDEATSKEIKLLNGRFGPYIQLGNIEGKENLNIDKKFFIACTHQSAFETFYLQTIFDSPFFILKKELMLIPIFGWYLKKIGCVSINRNITTKDNLSFFDNLKSSILSAKGPLIIFPQGTRVSFNERPGFKKGTSRIYALNLTCLPVVINSGIVWPKSGYVQNPVKK